MIGNVLLEGMGMTWWLVLTIAVLLVTDLFINRRPSNFPPGPLALPFLGNILTGVDYKTMGKLAEEYGPVFSLRRGSDKIVYISGFKMVKEAMINQLDSFADRPVIPLFHVVFKGIGIILNNGYSWKMQRKFANTYLRNFGEEKKSLENHIGLESTFLCEAFKEEQGKPFNPHFVLNTTVSNIICSVLFGRRFDYNDETFQNILRLDNDAIVLSGSARAQLYDAFPGLMKYLPGPHQTIHSIYKVITDFLQNEIERHQAELNPDDPRDFVDAYLAEIEKSKLDPAAGFTIESLTICTLDLIEAGTETTATTLRWALVYMMNYPDIQGKVQAEIDRVIGQSRKPNMDDRPNMPYTNAVIHETQRLGNIVPLGFPKMATKDAMLGGYVIPKGTTIITNLSSVLFDKDHWATPDAFNPEHFLDSNGSFLKREAFLPFSAGKRGCLGEQLARMELFLFFTTLLQRFTFCPVPGKMPSTECVMGFTNAPEQFRMLALPR